MGIFDKNTLFENSEFIFGNGSRYMNIDASLVSGNIVCGKP